ncbi:hypothetical protein ACWT_3572 [Actinoplanes sp. SE50]|uniref:hypothetical protein n=1 Tax=unclassified Actinoplanes TaxID=2626549 RepID=UPI00023EC0E5|nr:MULTISPECIES: hypothetical protein [unclassified Actinoplanes]AEV84595.1 hypothetical protein ACPL_3700 [Actinoplanes sp. SE50/110]ATO82987.1 hypothetical protein ACWT_3572 [Actinoplanes sp. SE50]SLM00395.1 hypothetical protein ACSP50_3627 [Actinoplanes sp. SE50/110]
MSRFRSLQFPQSAPDARIVATVPARTTVSYPAAAAADTGTPPPREAGDDSSSV